MTKRIPLVHLGWLLAAAFLALAAGCGSGGISCEEFEAQPDPGGELCDRGSDCSPVDCPCADGTVIEARSCFNGVCEGKAACEDACRGAGGQLDCSGGGSNGNGNGSCDPVTCDSLGAECGTPADGCGGTLSCGGCSGNASCDDGQCIADEECQPDSCERLDAECGELSDGCGGTLSCGDCDDGLRCSSATCVAPQVTGSFCPSTCSPPAFLPAVVECQGCQEEYCHFDSDGDGTCTRECVSDPDCTDLGTGWSCNEGAGYCVP